MWNLIFCLAVLNNKNSASEFEDLTGFVKGLRELNNREELR